MLLVKEETSVDILTLVLVSSLMVIIYVDKLINRCDVVRLALSM